ncbi:MAG: PIN domain-containing protein [Phycisphaerales bacterium]
MDSLRAIIGQYVVLPYDAEMAERWAQISEHRKRAGHPIATADCWIASTAVRHGLELLTHNGRDFKGVDSLITVTP